MDKREDTREQEGIQEESLDGSGKPVAEASPLKTWGEVVRELFPQANDQDVDFILWEMACYPFDTTRTLQQLSGLAAEVKPAEEGWELRMLKAAQRHDAEINEELSAQRSAEASVAVPTSPSNPHPQREG